MTAVAAAPDVVGSGRKVNLLIVASGLWIGGAETVIRHLALSLDPSRFKVTVCHLKSRGQIGDELANAGVDIVSLFNPNGEVDYLSSRKMLKLIQSRDIDVVHTHTTQGLFDVAMCKLLFRPRLKLVHTFHFGNYPNTRTRIMWMERICSRIATRIYAVGEVQRQQLRKVFGFRDSSIGTVWNGVDGSNGSGDPDLRARFSASDRIVIGTLATLIEQKGLTDLLRVAQKLKGAGKRVRFVIVGDGELKAPLEEMRRELGLEDIVTFTGWITNAAHRALPAFDIFFQPSLWEAMSMVILEAMAAGKPIVATRVGENPHVVADGVTGLLCNPRDVDGMAAALGRLVDDPALRQRFGAAGRARWRDNFTVQHMTSAYERAYLEALQ
ncbi:MAG TPA: glycosyltransferase family 4 protein [Vicinamibacterales bacterium]|jgi:glycosyltransferase involved in cell wall biosynthesis